MPTLRSMLDAVIPAAQAHEKWFVTSDGTAQRLPDLFVTANPYTVAATIIVILLATVGVFLDRRFEKSVRYAKLESKLRHYRDYAAGALSISAGFVLLWSAIHRDLLAPNFAIGEGFAGDVLRAVESSVGVLLIFGLFSPAAAIGLIALYASAFLLFPSPDVLDYINIAGIGLFLLFFSRGRYSLDWFLGKPILTTPQQRKWAYLALRVLTGIALLWLGLLKFRRPDLHFALMDMYPDFNPYVLLAKFGISMSREAYVFILFVVETTFGLFLLLGLLTRVLSAVLIPVMLGSLLFLGPTELVGHLLILATLCVFVVYGDTYHKHGIEPPRRP